MKLFMCYMCQNNISEKIYRAHDKSFCCNTCRNSLINLKYNRDFYNSINYKKRLSSNNLSDFNNIYYSKNNSSRCNKILKIIFTYFKKIICTYFKKTYINPTPEWDYYMTNL